MKLKSVFIALATFLMLGSLTFKLYSAEAIEGNTFAVGTSDEGIQLESNSLKPFTNDDISLGTSSLRFKDLYLSGDVAGGADIRTTNFLGLGDTYTVTVVTATTIAVTGTNLLLASGDNAGAITMTAEPVFAITNASLGDWLVVSTTETIATFVLDEGDQEALQLGGSTRTIGQFDSLYLILSSSDTSDSDATYWREVGFVDN